MGTEVRFFPYVDHQVLVSKDLLLFAEDGIRELWVEFDNVIFVVVVATAGHRFHYGCIDRRVSTRMSLRCTKRRKVLRLVMEPYEIKSFQMNDRRACVRVRAGYLTETDVDCLG